MIVAGIVLYNPELKRLIENINRIIAQVNKVLLIDNGSKNIEQINKILKDYNLKNIEIIYNSENKGIAYALNQILDYAYSNKYEWFITLDQDSIAGENLIKNYMKYIDLEKIAMMTCNIIDRNFKSTYEEENEVKYITNCITSGTLNNTEIIKKIGGYDNQMFIDYVDFDICATIKEKNYNIIKINYDGLLHEVGHAKKITILGKDEFIYNHSPFRTYYIIRNAIYFMYKHKEYNNIKQRLRITKRILLILIFQKEKLENLKSIIRALKDSKKMKKGKII